MYCDKLKQMTKSVIREHSLNDWFVEYPWLTGSLGNPNSPVWFVGEIPSMNAVKRVDKGSNLKSPNLQWSCLDKGAGLWREAVVGAGLKDEPACEDCGWRCYITNAIKEPKIVTYHSMDSQKNSYWREQADRWQSVLQAEIKSGSPMIIVTLGNQTHIILKYMETKGLKCPDIKKIYSYSYITDRPDNQQQLKRNHAERRKQYKRSIADIARQYPYSGC